MGNVRDKNMSSSLTKEMLPRDIRKIGHNRFIFTENIYDLQYSHQYSFHLF